MPSESARMSSAAEARFRVPVAASVSRAVKVAALDPATDRLVAALAGDAWRTTTFFAGGDAAGRSLRLIQDLAPGDLVIMVTAAGADVPVVADIGGACSDRRIATATFVVRPASATDEALSRTLEQVRPWSLMLMIVSDSSYVEDILRSFR